MAPDSIGAKKGAPKKVKGKLLKSLGWSDETIAPK